MFTLSEQYKNYKKLRKEIDPKEEEKKWIETKKTISKLSANYDIFIKTKMRENPDSVRIRGNNKGTVYEYTNRINGYLTVLTILKHKKKNDKAYYVAFNNYRREAYVRELNNIDDLQEI